jgi:hypothetical protein
MLGLPEIVIVVFVVWLLSGAKLPSVIRAAAGDREQAAVMKLQAQECLLVFGIALLFAMTQTEPRDLGAFRFVGIIAIGAVCTLTAALTPDRPSRGRR